MYIKLQEKNKFRIFECEDCSIRIYYNNHSMFDQLIEENEFSPEDNIRAFVCFSANIGHQEPAEFSLEIDSETSAYILSDSGKTIDRI